MDDDDRELIAHIWRSNLDHDVWLANVVVVGDIANGINAGRVRSLKAWVEDSARWYRVPGECAWVRRDEDRWDYVKVDDDDV